MPTGKVNIVLSTYNGAPYLSAQLDSILAQTVEDWQLLIRDDGSTDETVTIIEDYCARDKRIRFLNPMDRQNLGVHRSFYELIQAEKADYYILAAQDDIFKPEKLAIFLEAAARSDSKIPTVFYSNVEAIDETGAPSHHFWFDRAQRLSENLVGNKVGGMAMMINAALASRWIYRPVGAEDSYLALLALSIGQLIFIPEVTLCYRRHGAQQTAARTAASAERIQNFWTMIALSQRRTTAILEDYEKQIGTTSRDCLRDFLALKDAPIIKRLRIVCRWRFAGNSFPETVAIRFLLITAYGRQSGDQYFKEI